MRTREATISEWTFAAAIAITALWLGGILIAPVLASRALADTREPGDLKAGLKVISLDSLAYNAYRPVCHQRPDRSLHLGGHPLAVCARCFGIYSGFLFGLMIYPFIRSLRRTDLPPRLWLILALAPAGIDFLGGLAGAFENTHMSRLATGMIAGTAAAFYIIPGLIGMAAGWRGVAIKET